MSLIAAILVTLAVVAIIGTVEAACFRWYYRDSAEVKAQKASMKRHIAQDFKRTQDYEEENGP